MRDLDVLEAKILIDMGVALPMDAGYSNTDHVIGAQHAPGRFSAGDCEERKRGAGRDGLFQESAACDRFITVDGGLRSNHPAQKTRGLSRIMRQIARASYRQSGDFG